MNEFKTPQLNRIERIIPIIYKWVEVNYEHDIYKDYPEKLNLFKALLDEYLLNIQNTALMGKFRYGEVTIHLIHHLKFDYKKISYDEFIVIFNHVAEIIRYFLKCKITFPSDGIIYQSGDDKEIGIPLTFKSWFEFEK